MNREQVLELFEKADEALSEGRISKKEHDAFLNHHFQTNKKHEALEALGRKMHDADGAPFTGHTTAIVAGFFVVMVSLFAVMFYGTGGITGAVVLDIPIAQDFSENASIPLILNSTSKVTLIGEASGYANILVELVQGSNVIELYSYDQGPVQTEHARMATRTWEEGMTVSWEATNVNSTYLLAEEALPLGNRTSVQNLSVGDYTLRLLVDDGGLSEERIDFSVVEPGMPEPSEEVSSCGDACSVNLSGNITIRITFEGDGIMTVGALRLSSGNSAPELLAEVPDLTGNEQVILDLRTIFSDQDGDILYYESSHYEDNTENITEGVLMISGSPGTYSYVVYASDLTELTSSNLFTVSFTGGVPPETNEANTTEDTTQETNVTQVNETQETNVTKASPPRGNCDHPDPNKRPVECLQESETEYFRPQTILITDTDRARVARITPIGNLIIRGEVIEGSTEEPGRTDYTIGYEDASGDFITTVWFSSEDVHLTGTLYEEELYLSPPAGSFVLRNRRGIALAWVDVRNGDLHIRGNVIRGGDIR